MVIATWRAWRSFQDFFVSVNTSKKQPKGYYDLPSDYQVVSMQDQMNTANQQSQQMMEQMGGNMPDMNELMQQFQSQGGEIPEDAMKKLIQMQEMLEQYQQQ